MAWTITETIEKEQYTGGVLTMFRVKLACISDANASDHDVGSIDKNILNAINGSYLYLIKIVPGTGGDAPSGAFDLDIEDSENDHLVDSDANTEAANSFVSGSASLGVFPPIMGTCSLVCATLGAANTADIYLYFTRS
jgi:hypothetical protein